MQSLTKQVFAQGTQIDQYIGCGLGGAGSTNKTSSKDNIGSMTSSCSCEVLITLQDSALPSNIHVRAGKLTRTQSSSTCGKSGQLITPRAPCKSKTLWGVLRPSSQQ